jgi:hypothetical protein
MSHHRREAADSATNVVALERYRLSENTMNHTFKVSTLRLLTYLFLAWCVSVSLQAQTKPSASAQPSKQYEELRKDFLDLRKEVETLKGKLEFDEYLLSTKQIKTDSISLDLTQRSYQRLDTDTGFFLVSVEEALPYLNGYRIRLSVGNPSYATYKDYKLTVKWNKAYDWAKYTQASYDEWNKAIQEKEISFPDSLKPGAWNSVDLILAPVSPDQLGYLMLSMTTSTVSLHTSAN